MYFISTLVTESREHMVDYTNGSLCQKIVEGAPEAIFGYRFEEALKQRLAALEGNQRLRDSKDLTVRMTGERGNQ
jgi:hypothetical protein